MTTKQLHDRFQTAIENAHFAGLDAVEAATVTPMIVGTPKNMMASIMGGDGGGFDEKEPVYYVADGVCGFAWVNLKGKDTEGRKFLNWVQGKVKSPFPFSDVQPAEMSQPRKDNYYGGVTLWMHGYGQSMQKKEAFAAAFAASLRNAGIAGLDAYSMSRMD